MSMKNQNTKTEYHTVRPDLSRLAAGPRVDLLVADTQGRCRYTVLRPAHGSAALKPYTSGVVQVRGKGCAQVG